MSIGSKGCQKSVQVLEDVQASKQQLKLSKPVILEVLQHMHVEQGAMLMQHWNIPELYVEIVRQHHDETYDTNNTLLFIPSRGYSLPEGWHWLVS
jgi:HD-like signal output (HDOD) protein